MDVSRNERMVVDETIESALGHDHVRLADVMFELVKNEEHYRVLAKHCAKPHFLERYLERMVPIRQVVYDDSDDDLPSGSPLPVAPENSVARIIACPVYDVLVPTIVYDDSDEEGPLATGNDEAPAVRQIVYDDSDGEVDKDQVRQIPYDDSDDERPLGTNNDEVVVTPSTGAANLQEFHMVVESRAVAPDVVESTELETKTEPVAVELIDASDPSRMVELRPRGVSAVPDDVGKLAEGDEWVPLKTRGNSMLQEPAGLEVEELQTANDDAQQLGNDTPKGPSLGEDTQVVRELKELPTKFEMVDLVPPEPEAAEEELVQKAPVSSSLFNPPARPILFGKAPVGAPKPSATTNSLQQRLQKKKEAEAKNKEQDVNIDNEADTFVLTGSISKAGTTPWMDPRQQKEIDTSELPRMPDMHSGPSGTYDRDPGGNWNRKGSDLSVS